MEYHDSLKALEVLQYIKITDDCVVYDSEAVINVECFELRSKADEIFSSKNINYEELAETLRDIFPAKIRGGGGKLVKSPTMAVVDKLKKFFKFYHGYRNTSAFQRHSHHTHPSFFSGWQLRLNHQYRFARRGNR